MTVDDGPVLVLVEARPRPGRLDAVLNAFRRSQAASKQWEGCRGIEIAAPLGRDDALMVVERWDSVAQHRQRLAQVSSSEGFAAFRELLDGDLTTRYLRLC